MAVNHPGSDGGSVLSGGWRDGPIFDRTQAGTTTGRRHPPHMRVTPCRPWSDPQPRRVPTRQIDADQTRDGLPRPRPYEPPDSAKPQVNSHTGGSPVFLPLWTLGELTTHKTPGQSPGEAATEAARPHRTRSPNYRTAQTVPCTASPIRAGRKAHRRLPDQSNRVPTGRPVQDRPQDSQPDTAAARRADAPNRSAPRTGPRGCATLRGRLVHAEPMNTDQRTIQRRLGEHGVTMRGTHEPPRP